VDGVRLQTRRLATPTSCVVDVDDWHDAPPCFHKLRVPVLAARRLTTTAALTMMGGASAALLLHVRAYLGDVDRLPRNAR
jgi:hypothetical protein